MSLSNPSRILKTKALEPVLWLIIRVYFFDSPGTEYEIKEADVSVFVLICQQGVWMIWVPLIQSIGGRINL